VKVTVPGLLPITTAKNFVEEKKGWISEKLDEFSKLSYKRNAILEYRTKRHELKLTPKETSKVRILFQNEFVNVTYPENLKFDDSIVQNAVVDAVEMAFRKEAQEILPPKVNCLAEKYGFEFNTLRIKKITSRWGSCSNKNNINLSIYLMKLPEDLIDYIIIHELTHTIHKNHGPNFWNHLNKLTGDAKGLAARVKKYRTGI
jgi:predicted metal-dependent hydrolase